MPVISNEPLVSFGARIPESLLEAFADIVYARKKELRGLRKNTTAATQKITHQTAVIEALERYVRSEKKRLGITE